MGGLTLLDFVDLENLSTVRSQDTLETGTMFTAQASRDLVSEAEFRQPKPSRGEQSRFHE
jgi:hypothetical protein